MGPSPEELAFKAEMRLTERNDDIRLRAAVKAWAMVSGEHGSFSDYSTACDRLRELARELGLVDE